jgi:hypothetical protein
MEPMYRISVTTLEKFRRYMCEESSFDSEASLIESIKGLFTGNDKTKFGGAYHELIEGKYQYAGGLFKSGDFIFSKEQAEPALYYREQHPLMVHEMTISKVYDTLYWPIQVGGRLDGIEGIEIRDIKTKFRAFSVEEYLDSCQWKFYLDIQDLEVFWYDVFEVKGFDGLPNLSKQKFYSVYDEKKIKIIPHPAIHCLRYEGMDHDLISLINSFLEYMHNRNLLTYLKPALQYEDFIF